MPRRFLLPFRALMLCGGMFAPRRSETQLGSDLLRNRFGLAKRVLPESQDAPADVTEGFRDNNVAVSVAFEFWNPIIAVAAWPATVLGTSVPEATVHKYRETLASKDEIRPSLKFLISTPAGNSVRA